MHFDTSKHLVVPESVWVCGVVEDVEGAEEGGRLRQCWHQSSGHQGGGWEQLTASQTLPVELPGAVSQLFESESN